MNRQQLLSRLAGRGWRIAYSTGSLSVWDRGSLKWEGAKLWSSVKKADGVVVDLPGKLLVRWPRFASYDGVVLRRHALRLRRAAGWNAEGTVRVAYLFHPEFFPYLRYLRADFVVYHVYDLHRGMGGYDQAAEGWEETLVNDCNLLTAINEEVAGALPGRGPEKALVLGNGVDYDLFGQDTSESDEPADLAEVPRPRICYTGNINPKLDWETIEFVARNRPNWHWIFVGQIRSTDFPRPEIARAWEACRRYQNVHFLGGKPREAVPTYVRSMDVCTICYRTGDGDWVGYGYPLKLHEYLACGKPTICSDMPTVRQFQPAVRIARDGPEWMRAIEQAMAEDGEEAIEARKQVARDNSWEKRVDQLEEMLARMLNGTGRGES
jgi:glycosyltransferase involved in cell wall biosynthesis